MKGYNYVAKTIHGYDVTHVFYIEAMFRMAMREMEALGVKGIMAHSENGAVIWQMDMRGLPANLESAWRNLSALQTWQVVFQDAWLINSPVIAITGKKSPKYQYPIVIGSRS